MVLPCRVGNGVKDSQEHVADDATQQDTLLILQYTSLPEVTGECLPDGGERSAFERRRRESK